MPGEAARAGGIPPPPTIEDLIFPAQSHQAGFGATLGALKRSTLSIGNRLASIERDAAFALAVGRAYGGRPLVANERCGSWYVPPGARIQHRGSSSSSVYFKSTDGHTGAWKFSLRRLNLGVLDVVGLCDGCVIIDSTRRGKRMPDALSKTIPIWCSVMNRLLFPDRPASHALFTPPHVVSASEHAQISALLPRFLESLLSLGLPVAALRRKLANPLRPIWVTPESTLPGEEEGEGDRDGGGGGEGEEGEGKRVVLQDYHPIICCTVSRRVPGGEVSQGGYIQGAGDDTENWAHGLTPPLFWAHRALLTQTPEPDLPALIQSLVRGAASELGAADPSAPVPTFEEVGTCITPTTTLYIAKLTALPPSPAAKSTTPRLPPLIVALHATSPTPASSWRTSLTRLDVHLGQSKLGSRNLRHALPVIHAFIQASLTTDVDADPAPTPQILIACASATDLSIGVALALLCSGSIYAPDGALRPASSPAPPPPLDKTSIRRRLAWITTCLPDANPSRATLVAVNRFLMPG